MAVLKDVKVLFSNVLNPDDLSTKYQIVVQLTEEQAADAEEAGLNVKTKEHDGKTQFRATFKTKFKPRIVGIDGKTDLELSGEIGRHSLISVQYKFREWKAPGGKQGTGQDLQMVQVKDLESPNASEFEDESNFGDAGGDY